MMEKYALSCFHLGKAVRENKNALERIMAKSSPSANATTNGGGGNGGYNQRNNNAIKSLENLETNLRYVLEWQKMQRKGIIFYHFMHPT